MERLVITREEFDHLLSEQSDVGSYDDHFTAAEAEAHYKNLQILVDQMWIKIETLNKIAYRAELTEEYNQARLRWVTHLMSRNCANSWLMLTQDMLEIARSDGPGGGWSEEGIELGRQLLDAQARLAAL